MSDWRRIANRLASRLVHHAQCERHPLAEADPECPFCADRAAFEAYVAAGGTVQRWEPTDGRTIALDDIVAGTATGRPE